MFGTGGTDNMLPTMPTMPGRSRLSLAGTASATGATTSATTRTTAEVIGTMRQDAHACREEPSALTGVKKADGNSFKNGFI